MGEQEKIEVELTSRDVVDFNFTYVKRNGGLWVIAFLGIGFFANFIIQLSLGRPFESYAFSIFFVLISALYPVMLYRGAVRSSQNKFLQEKKSYDFTSEGFRMDSESTTSKVLWPDVQRVIVSKKGIYLFIASNAGHLFPRRFLEGKDRIRTMVLQYTTPKSRTRGKSKLPKLLAVYLLIFLVTVGIVQFFLS
ncbi:YcxB family protein [Cohnella lupini]|uniref:YcxB-like protein n=1 Tax=Cohnella lupini TaxID=1294267 RepID=A0A3D9I1J8_9BACL|nr:YcxB family protein [Cohnella lupini]RED55520.1 YcxB-like protein [Cohnella lupini]